MTPHYVQIAHAITRRHGETRYRALALDGIHGHKHYNGRFLGLGDTREEAEREALAYVVDQFRRQGITPPDHVINRGKVAGVILDNALFWRDE